MFATCLISNVLFKNIAISENFLRIFACCGVVVRFLYGARDVLGVWVGGTAGT